MIFKMVPYLLRATGSHGRPRDAMEAYGSSRELTGGHGKPREATGRHGRQREATGRHGRPREITGGFGSSRANMHFVCVLCQQLTERVCHKLCELHSVAHAPFVVCVFHLFYSYVFPCLYTCLYAFRSPILGGRPREPTRAHGSPREPTRANGSSRKQPGATKSSLNPRASAVLSWWGPLGGTPAPPPTYPCVAAAV